MSSRDAILQRVRSAIADVPPGPPEADTPVPWEYGRPTAMPDVLAQFVERVEDYKAVVVRATAKALPAAVAAALRAGGTGSVIVPDGIPQSWLTSIADAGVEIRRDDPPLTHAELNATDAVVTTATVGIAETGTIVLDHVSGQGRRALSLVPDFHVCVVDAGQVVSDVPESVGVLAQALRERRALTWISGPSATSDIELDRVEGVHGPRTLHVILVDG